MRPESLIHPKESIEKEPELNDISPKTNDLLIHTKRKRKLKHNINHGSTKSALYGTSLRIRGILCKYNAIRLSSIPVMGDSKNIYNSKK